MSCSSKSPAGLVRSAPQRGQPAVCCSTSAKQSGQYHWTIAFSAHSSGCQRRACEVRCAAHPLRSHTTARQPRSDGRNRVDHLGGALTAAVAPARPALHGPGHRRLGTHRATGPPTLGRRRRSAPSLARPDRCHGQREATTQFWQATPQTIPAVETMQSPDSSSRRCERSHQPSKAAGVAGGSIPRSYGSIVGLHGALHNVRHRGSAASKRVVAQSPGDEARVTAPPVLMACGCQVYGSPHATCAYSWISPPRRSRRTTVSAGTTAGSWEGPSGGACSKARCGR
jgi:hypothetical protein